jgi:hypothetical protein
MQNAVADGPAGWKSFFFSLLDSTESERIEDMSFLTHAIRAHVPALAAQQRTTMNAFLCFVPLAILASALCSCSSIKPNDFEKGFLANHVITVSARGTPEVLTNGVYRHDNVPHLAKVANFPGPLQQQFTNELQNMYDNIASRAPTRDGKKQILIFAHGGLNTESARLDRVQELIGMGQDDPACQIKNYYPIFINWESGLFSSYGEHLTSVRAGHKYAAWGGLGLPLSPFVLFADFGKSIAKTPSVWVAQITTDAKAAGVRTPAVKNSDALYEFWTHAKTNPVSAAHAVNISRGETNCNHKLRAARDIMTYTLTVPTKFISAPFIDGLGQSAWENMYRRTETMFHSVYEFDLSWGRRTTDWPAVGQVTEGQATGALGQFLNGLEKRFGTNGYEITLVAHSAGAIVMNKVLQRYPELPYRKVIYMAAACPISELEGSVIPVMQRQPHLTFHVWCLNPRAELNESNAYDLAPRGSLLEWIDNFLGSPRTATDRTLGKWENILQTAHVFPPEVRPRVFIEAEQYQPGCASFTKTETCDGITCQPQKHADYGRKKFWEEKAERFEQADEKTSSSRARSK